VLACPQLVDHIRKRGWLLFIEYDVNQEGEIELVALVNAVEKHDADPDGESWLAWRKTFDDEGLGCAPVPATELDRMERSTDPAELRSVVERIILDDRAAKEVVPE
jgi:hypothetical protein